MEILDVDMQMVRDALKDAPEFAKGHFENLLSQYETAAARVEELKEVESDLEHAQTLLKSAEEDVATLEKQLAQRDSDQDAALEAVKYWLIDVLVLRKPVSDPRKILCLVEDAL